MTLVMLVSQPAALFVAAPYERPTRTTDWHKSCTARARSFILFYSGVTILLAYLFAKAQKKLPNKEATMLKRITETEFDQLLAQGFNNEDSSCAFVRLGGLWAADAYRVHDRQSALFALSVICTAALCRASNAALASNAAGF